MNLFANFLKGFRTECAPCSLKLRFYMFFSIYFQKIWCPFEITTYHIADNVLMLDMVSFLLTGTNKFEENL